MFDVYKNGRTVVHLEKLRRFEGYNQVVLSDFLSGGRRKSVMVFVIWIWRRNCYKKANWKREKRKTYLWSFSGKYWVGSWRSRCEEAITLNSRDVERRMDELSTPASIYWLEEYSTFSSLTRDGMIYQLKHQWRLISERKSCQGQLSRLTGVNISSTPAVVNFYAF